MSEHPITLHANHFSREKQVCFLEALSLWGSVRAACRAVPVAPQTVYRARRSSRDFALAWDAAVVVARPHVEDVLSDRALNGVEEPVFYHGEEIARRRRFDSRLLLAHLARLDRAEDRDDVREVAEGFDAALERMRCGEPVAPLSADGDGGDDREHGSSDAPEPWLDESLPFTERVLLYLEHIESDEAEDDEELADEIDPGDAFEEGAEADCAASADECDDGAGADDAGDEAGEGPPSAAPDLVLQDRVTPVTLPDPAEPPCAPEVEETAVRWVRRRRVLMGPNVWSLASPFE